MRSCSQTATDGDGESVGSGGWVGSAGTLVVVGAGWALAVAGVALGVGVGGIRGVGDGRRDGVEDAGPSVGVPVTDVGAGELVGLGRGVGLEVSVGSGELADDGCVRCTLTVAEPDGSEAPSAVDVGLPLSGRIPHAAAVNSKRQQTIVERRDRPLVASGFTSYLGE